MYVKVKDGAVQKYPYSIGELIGDNPQTSFPTNPGVEFLADWGVYEVDPVDPPEHDPITETVTEANPQEENGRWTQTWLVTAASDEEAAARLVKRENEISSQRMAAYRDEADPIFFKAQRGEATMEEWLAKISEVKQRFPK